MAEPTRVDLVVNGTPRALDAPPHWRLLELLREGLGLTGTKEGCDDGTCGTCVVMVDGKATRACRKSAGDAAGTTVITIEGLGSPGSPHALQQAFAAADAVQCGFCTPGMIMTAAALLERNPRPTRSEIARGLGSNLCRCTGYQGIVDAIEWVANGQQGSPRQWPAGQGSGEAASELARHVRPDALDKATGRALYAADLTAERMLHARALRSPHPHAEIVRIDTERARRLPGVEAVLTAADVPGENSYGRKVKDQPVLAQARVRQVGDPVALVVATSPEAAAAALLLIEVDYRPLPGGLRSRRGARGRRPARRPRRQPAGRELAALGRRRRSLRPRRRRRREHLHDPVERARLPGAGGRAGLLGRRHARRSDVHAVLPLPPGRGRPDAGPAGRSRPRHPDDQRWRVRREDRHLVPVPGGAGDASDRPAGPDRLQPSRVFRFDDEAASVPDSRSQRRHARR